MVGGVEECGRAGGVWWEGCGRVEECGRAGGV